MMKLLSILAIALVLQGTRSVVAKSCPPPEDVNPCYCVSDQTDIRIDCLQVTSIEDLRKGLSSLENYRDVYIDFQKSRFDRIPSDLFRNLHVTKLSFTNCDLKAFGDEGRSALEGLEDVIEELSFHFSFSEENELKFLNVSHLRALYQLEIEGNALSRLGDDWFRSGPSGVQNLFVMTNGIRELGSRAFASLENLKNLWLTGNSFQAVSRSMFPRPARQLVSLDLTNNKIENLPFDIFADMPSLKEVILAENEIQSIHETTWSPVWQQLTRVYLEDNPLECDSQIDWMFKLSRPHVLKGRCVSPDSRKGQDLKRLIDDKIQDENISYG